MRKIILLILLSMSVLCYSQRYERMTKTLSVRILQNHKWSRWMSSKVRVLLIIDADRSKVTIYSKGTQIYDIISQDSHYFDTTEGIRSECWEYSVIDQDGDIGTLVVRYGASWVQVYIRFADIQWVYYLE